MIAQAWIVSIFCCYYSVNGRVLPLNADDPELRKNVSSADQPNNEMELDQGIGTGNPLNETDFLNGDKLDLNRQDEVNPIQDAIEKSGQFEGDIILSNEQAAIIANGTEEALMSLRAATTLNYRKWPMNSLKAQVPYVLSSSFNSRERAAIARAISEFQSKTCIRIIPKTYEWSYISVIRSGSSCSSPVGRQGGVQYIRLTTNCALSVGVIIHEFMHAVGFWHEQSRSDRDAYIIINWANIQPNKAFNFQKCASCTNQGNSYDVQSVMHYSRYAFSNGRGPTIQRRDCPTCSLGQRNGFSSLDVQGINTLYGCPKDGCVNNSPYCLMWAGGNSCKASWWLRTYCKRACRVC